MDCHRIASEIELTEELREHAKSCRSCSKDLEQWEKIVSELRASADLPVNEIFVQKVRGALKRASLQRAKRRARLFTEAVAAAALLLFALLYRESSKPFLRKTNGQEQAKAPLLSPQTESPLPKKELNIFPSLPSKKARPTAAARAKISSLSQRKRVHVSQKSLRPRPLFAKKGMAQKPQRKEYVLRVVSVQEGELQILQSKGASVEGVATPFTYRVQRGGDYLFPIEAEEGASISLLFEGEKWAIQVPHSVVGSKSAAEEPPIQKGYVLAFQPLSTLQEKALTATLGTLAPSPITLKSLKEALALSERAELILPKPAKSVRLAPFQILPSFEG